MPPARKTAAKRTNAPADHTKADGAPVLELFTDETEQPPAPMEPAFKINGRMFYIPATIEAKVAIRYMDHCRKKGDNWALSWLLEEVLGAESYAALIEKNLKDEQLIAVVKIVQSKVLGDTAPKG